MKEPCPDRACQCAHHHATPEARTTWWSSLAPVLACAVCPSCLATWGKLLSIVGVGVVLGERAHGAILAVAVAVALGVAALRRRRTRRAVGFVLTLAGCAALAASHAAGDLRLLDVAGAALLIASGLVDRRGAAPARAG